MLKFLSSFMLIGLPVLSGCASWPPAGHGGMAEHHLETLPVVKPGHPPGPEHGLHFDFELVRQHLDILVLEGAEHCFPASVKQAKIRQNRIARELYGDLDFDAVNDLIIQRKLVLHLERRLDYVKQHSICELPAITNPQNSVDINRRIYNLLNIDNQFAFDSAELNPKYINRLTQATQLLRDHPAIQLRITGHADLIGAKQHNQKLSFERANKVAGLLQSLGMPASRLLLDAAGSDKPLFSGYQPHVRLVNRRVSIDLVETSASTQSTME